MLFKLYTDEAIPDTRFFVEFVFAGQFKISHVTNPKIGLNLLGEKFSFGEWGICRVDWSRR